MRADAQHNRNALVAAATEVFAELGLDAPLLEISRRSGLGSATLYRHFPTRTELIVEVFADRMADYLGAAQEALDSPDPWTGFRDFVRHLCLLQAGDRGVAHLAATWSDPGSAFAALSTKTQEDYTLLVTRAQAAGVLRDDYAAEDMVILVMASAGLAERMGDFARESIDRLIGFTLDGLRPDAATPAPPPIGLDAALVAVKALGDF